jgi:hypothetical protein
MEGDVRQSTGTAAMTALVMTGFVPAALIASTMSSKPLSQTVCELVLGGGGGGPGTCETAAAPAPAAAGPSRQS